MRGFGWNLPVQVRFDVGAVDLALADAAGRDVIVIAFQGASSCDGLVRWVEAWATAVLAWVELPDGLPTPEMVRKVAAQVWPRLAVAAAPLVVAIGGGAVMDVAKWVRCVAPDRLPASLDALVSLPVLPRGWQHHELWMLPTTAGTGSEVTRWSTLWDVDATIPAKLSFDQPYGYANRAYIDPQLTLSCPPAVVRDSALDALGHALEVMWNRHRNPLSMALAALAAARIIKHLPVALQDLRQLGARCQLSLAALEAGAAFSQTRTALAHAASYSLTLTQGVAHGAAVAVWLPAVWQLACGRQPETDAALASVFGGTAEHGAAQLRTWLADIGFDLTLGSLGIGDPQQVLAAALNSPRGLNFVESGHDVSA